MSTVIARISPARKKRSVPKEFGTLNDRRRNQMSEIVKCGVCGKVFNKRYVKSHKRLAHEQKSNLASSDLSEPELV
jgi:hypothetical protein